MLSVAAALLALLCLVLVGVYALLQTETGRTRLARYLESALSQPGRTVTIGRIDGRLPGEIRIDELTVADREGDWLTIRALALDWRPLSLIAGRLQVDAATAGKIAFSRRPIVAAPADKGAAPGIPPLDIAVRGVAVERLRLEEPVLGAAADLRASAEMAVSTDEIRLQLDIGRTDAVAGRANAIFGYDPATGQLELRATLSEPRGGLVARLMALPQLPAIEFAVSGEGTAADWQGTVSLDAEELASLDSRLTVSLGDRRTRIALDGRGRPGPAAGPTATSVFGPETEFAVTLSRPDGAGPLTVTAHRLRSAAIEADGAADLALPDGNIEGNLRIVTRDAARIAPLILPARLGGATVEGRLEGPLSHPDIEFDAVIDGLALDSWSTERMELHARLAPDGPIGRAAAIGMTARATLTQFRSPLPELNAALGDRTGVTVARAELLNLAELNIGDGTVSGARIRGSVAGSAIFETGRVTAGGRIELDDVSSLSARVGRPLQGRLHTSYHVTQDPADGLSIDLDGTLHDGRFDLPVAEALVGPEAAIAGRIGRSAAGHWRISDITVSGRGATATGAISVPPGTGTIAVDYAATVSDLAPLGLADPARPGGTLEIRGKAAGPAANPAVDGVATLIDAAPGGFALERLTARYALPGPARELTGRIEIEGRNALLPDLAGRTDIAIEKDSIRLAGLRLTSRATTVEGRLAIPLAGPPLTGTLKIEADDLGTWSPVAGRPLAGKVSAVATLTAEETRQQVALEGSVTAFALNGTVVSQELSATAKITDALGERGLAISVKSGAGRVGPVQLRSLTADIAGTMSDARVGLRADADFRGPVRLDVEGTVQRKDDRTVVTIAKLTGQAMGAPVALQRPAVIDMGPAGDLVDADLALAGGTMRAKLRRTPKEVSIEAAVRAVPLIALWPDAPPQADKSMIDADATVSGRVARPTGSFRLAVTGLAAGESDTRPEGLTLSMDGQLRDQRIVATGRLAGLAGVAADIDATVPVQVSLAPVVVRLDEAVPASGRIVFKGPIEPVVAMAGLDRHRLEGNADIEMTLSGPLRDPHIDGRVELTEGRYENLDTGTILAGVRIRARPSNETITIDEATASDDGSGRVTATGKISFGGTDRMAMSLDVMLDKARLVRRDELTAVSSGTVSLRGTAAERVISGRLNIEEAEVRLIGGTTPDVVQIEVEETGTPPAGVPPPPPAPKPSNTHLDLVISMPKRVFVRGRGLESEWGGELQVSGTTAAPRIQGELRPLRGRYDFVGKIFTLRQGSISFTGAEEVNPALNLSAERVATDLTAIIRVTGTARRPIIRLESIPEYPQDEVLSRVLFNKSTGRLSATEALQLGQAVATMTGATDGGGIMDFGRKMLRLDVLELKGAEDAPDGTSGQAGVEAGKYVTDDVYIGIESGAAGETGATVEIEVTPRLKIEGDVGQKEKEKIGIKWKRDY